MYPENNGEVMPKPYLRSERTMETKLIYASAGCPNNVDNLKRYGRRYAKIFIPPTVSLSDGRRLTWLRDLRPRYAKEGLYLGCRWSQASGVVASRCSGEATWCRQTRSGKEGDRGRRGTLALLRRALLCKKRNIKLSIQNFGSTSPAR